MAKFEQYLTLSGFIICRKNQKKLILHTLCKLFYLFISMSQTIQQIFKEKFIRIREFLQTQSNERTDEGLIDMRNVLESFPFFIQFTK